MARFLSHAGVWAPVFFLLAAASVGVDVLQLVLRRLDLTAVIVGLWVFTLLLGGISFGWGFHVGLEAFATAPPDVRLPMTFEAISRALNGASLCLILLVPLTGLHAVALTVRENAAPHPARS